MLAAVENFLRAARDPEFAKHNVLQCSAGQFFHFLPLIPIDAQRTARMERDTLYSTAVADISAGAMLTVPDPGDRNVTARLVNQIRDIADAFSGDGASSALFVSNTYAQDDLRELVSTSLVLGSLAPDSARSFRPRNDTGAVLHGPRTTAGWGGLREVEGFCLNADPGLPIEECLIEAPANVSGTEFWSIDLSNASEFFEENVPGAFSMNFAVETHNDDGNMTVHLSGGDSGSKNCRPLREGWTHASRLYQPIRHVTGGNRSSQKRNP